MAPAMCSRAILVEMSFKSGRCAIPNGLRCDDHDYLREVVSDSKQGRKVVDGSLTSRESSVVAKVQSWASAAIWVLSLAIVPPKPH